MAFVDNVRRSIEFYKKLGFKLDNIHTPEGGDEPVWAWLKSGDGHLMVTKASDPVVPEQQAVLFYMYCSDVDEYRKVVIDAGVEAGPIQYPFYAPRGEFRVTDPDGYVLLITHTR